MRYISTRGNYEPVASSRAIALGMVPGGGLFVPDSILPLDGITAPARSYQDVARRILAPFLTDFSPADIDGCVSRAYNAAAFDTESIVDLIALDDRRFVLELWHGPTAAFKDVALQIMPHFLARAKEKTNDPAHTVILVATSGDTGKAALEGFKNAPGISIIVFYPHGGVSEIQRLQMVTTDGANTHAAAVMGNFDDCQTAVKKLFDDPVLTGELARRGGGFSSANSINWGRLCPQVVYYVKAYLDLVGRGTIRAGQPIDFCVPTGNFGNILAGYYALRLGLPVRRLICASNKNNVLAEFLAAGVYDRNRDFHRTMSPSMDILISSNLERFLFEVTGHDGGRTAIWFEALAKTGRFAVDGETLGRMRAIMTGGWVDEPRVLETIGRTYRRNGYVLDTHTAVAAAVLEEMDRDETPVVIASTASPFKFSRDVLAGLTGEIVEDEFRAIERVAELSGTPTHRAVADLRKRPILHDWVIGIEAMAETVLGIVDGIPALAGGRGPGR